MLRGDIIIIIIFFFCFLFHIVLHWLLIYIMRLFMIYVFYFMFCEIKNLFCFTCIFHACINVFIEVFQEYTSWFSRAAVYTCNW